MTPPNHIEPVGAYRWRGPQMANQEAETWHPSDGGPCPDCGCPHADLKHDVVQGEGVTISVVDCPLCERCLWSSAPW